MYTVYILYSFGIDRYYVGSTNDLVRRLSEHNRRKGKYTDQGIPWKVVYTETYRDKRNARMREKAIKKRKSRIYIEMLIDGSEGRASRF
jgi:putative endonuclease